uniref:dolichyl-diphosphooligosaccharide--protein glycotransferase n=1 Tax=Peronospora matthiolae TaxID=2874970 RepID=A0AAV1THW9_9STRA
MTPITSSGLLAATCVLSFSIRLFPVVHEFDPQFNFRVTKFLAQHGVYELLDWFDDRAWYPLGRVVGTTVYPGLMAGAVALQWLLSQFLRVPLSIRDACVFFAPALAALACVAQFLLTLEVTGNVPTALLSAMLLGVSPAYISRSTAGSFDNEGIAIFLLIFTFYLWVKAVKTGLMLWAALAAGGCVAMALSWGGYVFIVNLIPIHVLVMLLSGKYSSRIYVAYSTFYPLATLGVMQVPFIGFNAVLKGENAGSHGVFALLQVYAFMQWLSTQLSPHHFLQLLRIVVRTGTVIVVGGLLLVLLLGKLQWSGRSLTLLDPTYASKYIPIIASVGEHQPTVWSAFYFSLGPAMLFIPLGLFYTFQKMDAASVFMIVYTAFAFYFSGIMVRLLLTLAPVACYLSAVGLSGFVHKIIESTRGGPDEVEECQAETTNGASSTVAIGGEERHCEEEPIEDVLSAVGTMLRFQSDERVDSKKRKAPKALLLLAVACGLLLVIHVRQSFKIATKVYSSTSLVFEKMNTSTMKSDVHDDYREAFAWLRQNTPENAKILSWWDYGYQITTLANRTVLVDNNTWNNTHIATVGRVLVSREDDAAPILQSFGVNYVFLQFGGKVGLPGDDLNKLPWIVKISEGVFPDDVIESEFQVNGRYVFDENATLAMTESVLYKLSYFEFNQVRSSMGTEDKDPVFGWDLNRRVRISQQDIDLHHFQHVFTSREWIVRIYRVKPAAAFPLST